MTLKKLYVIFDLVKQEEVRETMSAIQEKELSAEIKLKLVRDIIGMFSKQGISYRQSFELLDSVKEELQKLPLTEFQR